MTGFFALPSEIAGVKIPQISLEDLEDIGRLKDKAAEIATNAGLKAAGLDQAQQQQAEEVNKILMKGVGAVKDSCQVLSASADAVRSIQAQVKPVLPLLCVAEDPITAFQYFSQENLQTCMKVIEHVLGLSVTLQTIGKVLKAVQDAFAELSKVAQPLIDKVMESFGDIAKECEAALHFQGALTGIESFFGNISSMVQELGTIKEELGPIVEAWGKNDYSTAAQFGAAHWETVVDAMQRLMPAWVGCQELYNTSRDFCESFLDQTNALCKSITNLVKALCQQISIEVPAWMLVGDPLAGVSAPSKVEAQDKVATKPLNLPFSMDEEQRSRIANCCQMLMSVLGGGSRTRANEQTARQPLVT